MSHFFINFLQLVTTPHMWAQLQFFPRRENQHICLQTYILRLQNTFMNHNRFMGHLQVYQNMHGITIELF
jgi:hypothetical protein